MVWTLLFDFYSFVFTLYPLYSGAQKILNSASFQMSKVCTMDIRTWQLISSLAAKLNFCTWASAHRSFLMENSLVKEGPADGPEHAGMCQAL